MAVNADFTRVFHFAYIKALRVNNFGYLSGIQPRRGYIQPGGGFHTDSFVRSFGIIFHSLKIESLLLISQVPAAYRLQLLADIPVHTLVASILFRMTRLDPVEPYSQCLPPRT